MKHLYRIIIMSLMVFLPSSSFFLSMYLVALIEQHNISPAQLNLADELNHPAVDLLLFKQQKEGTALWFKYGFRLAKSKADIALVLANYYLVNEQAEQAEVWYKVVIQQTKNNKSNKVENTKVSAILALANLYQQQGDFANSKVLYLLAMNNADILTQAMLMAVAQGDEAFIAEYAQALKANKLTEKLFNQLTQYQVIKSANIDEINNAQQISGVSCANSVQMFATNLNDLNHSQQLIEQFANAPLASHFCFAKPKYIPIQTLDCQYETGKAIECNEQIWQKYRDKISSRYLVVMLPQGGANVHLGIMYLDSKDNVEVFAHELSHFLGFIDEYALPKGHLACKTNNKAIAHNLVILPALMQGKEKAVRAKILKLLPWAKLVEADTPLFTKTAKGWLIGTPAEYAGKVGLFSAKTCNHNGLLAFKPVAQTTQLEYFETPFPEVYLSLLNQAPENSPFVMPSYLYNLSLQK